VFMIRLLCHPCYSESKESAVMPVTGLRDLRSKYVVWPKLKCGREIGWVTR
jgi:hypothetical protein